jgi:hypothetical protein
LRKYHLSISQAKLKTFHACDVFSSSFCTSGSINRVTSGFSQISSSFLIGGKNIKFYLFITLVSLHQNYFKKSTWRQIVLELNILPSWPKGLDSVLNSTSGSNSGSTCGSTSGSISTIFVNGQNLTFSDFSKKLKIYAAELETKWFNISRHVANFDFQFPVSFPVYQFPAVQEARDSSVTSGSNRELLPVSDSSTSGLLPVTDSASTNSV